MKRSIQPFFQVKKKKYVNFVDNASELDVISLKK